MLWSFYKVHECAGSYFASALYELFAEGPETKVVFTVGIFCARDVYSNSSSAVFYRTFL